VTNPYPLLNLGLDIDRHIIILCIVMRMSYAFCMQTSNPYLHMTSMVCMSVCVYSIYLDCFINIIFVAFTVIGAYMHHESSQSFGMETFV